ncbi:tripartite tricarboxylate transporter permease [Candidatus Micrarchaeota archaeon]|nr:tripartite tricarboxylate transporter permease [Candidatus Micrarchaeota archaeon]
MKELLLGQGLGALGLLPFVHTNLLLQLTRHFIGEGIPLAVFAVAVSFSHLVFQTVPSLFLFLPSEAHGMNIVPYQEIARAKKTAVALRIILTTFLLALLLSIALHPLIQQLLPIAYEMLKPHMVWMLPLLILLFFASETSMKSLACGMLVFFLAGALGNVAFTVPGIREPLFPLLTGLFALPAVLMETRTPQSQATETLQLKLKKSLVVGGVLAGAFSVLFPALSVSVLAGILLLFLEKKSGEFIVLASSIASSKLFYEFVAALTIEKGRSLAAVWIVPLASLPNTTPLVPFIALVALTATGFASATVLLAHGKLASVLQRIPRTAFRIILLTGLLCLAYLFEGTTGVMISVSAGAVGALPILLNTRRSHAAGALLVPAAMHFAGISLDGILL